VQSEGWEVFRDAMSVEWGDSAVLDRLTETLARKKDAGEDDEKREFSKLLNARAQMRSMLEWPIRELKRIGHPQAKPTVRRRA
jgi:hypothetical protein